MGISKSGEPGASLIAQTWTERLLRVYGPAKAAGTACRGCQGECGMARLADLVEIAQQAGPTFRSFIFGAQSGAIGAAIGGLVRIDQLRHQARCLAARSGGLA